MRGIQKGECVYFQVFIGSEAFLREIIERHLDLLACVTDALGEGPGALAGDFDKARVSGDLVE